MARHERRTLTVSFTVEELHAIYEAVTLYGRELETTGVPGEAKTLGPLLARLSEAWDAAVPKRRR
jgi:hypothetical protein